MKKVFHILLIISFIWFGGSIHGMKRKNNSVCQDNQTQTLSLWQMPEEIICTIASHCLPKEKNILLKVCKAFNTYLKNKEELARLNPSTIFVKNKLDHIFKYITSGDESKLNVWLKSLDNVNDINLRNHKDFAPLHVASKKNNKDIVQLIINYGANIDEQNKDGRTPLFYAVEKGNIDMVQLLINAGANIHLPDEDDAHSPLHCAAYSEYAEIVKLLIDTGAQVNRQDENGCTPLEYAVQNNNHKMVKLLLFAGAQDEGDQGLSLASALGYTEIVKLLLCSGTRINLANNRDDAPLFDATRNNNAEIVQLLLWAGTNINLADVYQETALHYATRHRSTETVKLLIDTGANLDLVNRDGKTPLHIAAEKNYADIAQLLIDAGANLNRADNNGTALHYAVWNGNPKMVKLLLDADANIHLPDGNRSTPLDFAQKLWAAFNNAAQSLAAEEKKANLDNEDPLIHRLANQAKITSLLNAKILETELVKDPFMADIKNFIESLPDNTRKK
jgi:ankyrin repeat protein